MYSVRLKNSHEFGMRRISLKAKRFTDLSLTTTKR
jgi:hypothetical protein